MNPEESTVVDDRLFFSDKSVRFCLFDFKPKCSRAASKHACCTQVKFGTLVTRSLQNASIHASPEQEFSYSFRQLFEFDRFRNVIVETSVEGLLFVGDARIG